MKLTFLTANIALGLRRMDNPLFNLVGHLRTHGFSILGMLIAPAVRMSSESEPNPKRTDFLHRHMDLTVVLGAISSANADVICICEAIFQLHRIEINSMLKGLGYQTVAWGRAARFPHANLSVVIASRLRGNEVHIDIPLGDHFGGGAGCCAIRLRDTNITVV